MTLPANKAQRARPVVVGPKPPKRVASCCLSCPVAWTCWCVCVTTIIKIWLQHPTRPWETRPSHASLSKTTTHITFAPDLRERPAYFARQHPSNAVTMSEAQGSEAERNVSCPSPSYNREPQCVAMAACCFVPDFFAQRNCPSSPRAGNHHLKSNATTARRFWADESCYRLRSGRSGN